MTTLNSYEEIKLSELLIELHPKGQIAKFCRSGGEANALAIRIARAAAKKKILLFVVGWRLVPFRT